MAIPSVNMFSNQPGGGLVTAMGGINSLAHNMLKRKYYAPDIESQINNRNALTEGQNIQNEYMPDKLRLANTLAQLQNQFYAPNMQSEIDQRNSLTNKYNTMLPLEAKELELKNQFYPDVTRSQITAQKAMANFRNSGGAGMGVGQKELKGFESQLSNEHPEWTPEQTNQAASAYLSGDSALPDGTPLPPISGLGKTYLDQILKRGNTAQGLNQQRFAATTDKLLDVGAKLLPSVAQYAGALGKAQGSMDAVSNSLGKDSPAYRDYMYFTRTFVPTAAGEMMRALGVNASDTQKAIYQQVINPLAWDQNPEGAIENYKKMQQMFNEAISGTVGKSPNEIKNILRNGTNNEPRQNKYEVDYNKPMGSTPMRYKGKLYFVPSNKVKEAVEKGYKYDE